MSPRGFEEDRKREQDRAAGHICSFLPNLPPSTGTSSSLSYPHIILRPLRRRRVNIPSIHGKVAVLCPVVQMTELQRDKERIYSRSGLRPEPKAPDLWLMVCLLTQHTSPKSYGWSLSFDHHKLPGQNSLMIRVLKTQRSARPSLSTQTHTNSATAPAFVTAEPIADPAGYQARGQHFVGTTSFCPHGHPKWQELSLIPFFR